MVCTTIFVYGYSDTRTDTKSHAMGYLRLPEYEVKLVQTAYELMVESTAYWYLDPIDASGTGLAFDGRPAIPYKTLALYRLAVTCMYQTSAGATLTIQAVQ